MSENEPTPQEMSDRLHAFGTSGDNTLFAQLFAYFTPRVKGFLMRGGASDQDAEDLAQDVMVKVYRKATLFDPTKASASTWIFRIARNARIDAIRRQAKPDLDPDMPELQPEEAPRADEECELNDRAGRIREAINGLSNDQQVVMKLHFYEDIAHSAIAERLNLPLGTVKSRLRLAFQKIRRSLEEVE